MTLDPINRPVGAEDTVYADAGAPIVSGAERKAAQVKSYEFQKEQERNDLATLLRTAEGRSFVLRLIGQCQPYQPIVMAEHQQAAVMEGRRRVGLWVIDLIQQLDPELYPNLLLAHLKHQRDLHSVQAGIAAAKPPPSL